MKREMRHDPFAGFDWSSIERFYGVGLHSTLCESGAVIHAHKGEYSESHLIDEEILTDTKYRADYILHIVEDLAYRVGCKDSSHSKTDTLDTELQLSLAVKGYSRLANEATARGDVAGSDAWLIALDAVETAIRSSRKAFTQQTWSMRGA
jgi:hypothetical protein